MHKKFIRKKGKLFGPYYYTTIKTKDGRIKTIYLGQNRKLAKEREKAIKQEKAEKLTHMALKPYLALSILLFLLLFVPFLGFKLTGFLIKPGISYQKIADDPAFDVIIDSLDFQKKDLIVRFHHNAEAPQPVTIIGNVSYQLDKDWLEPEEQAELRVFGWDGKEYFEIKVGNQSEVIGFGLPPEYRVSVQLLNREGKKIKARIELEKPETGELKYKAIGVASLKAKKGRYKIKLVPASGPIKRIEFVKFLSSDLDQAIKIDEPNLSWAKQTFAIDPGNLSLNLTVEAKGYWLYKCRNWDFETQTCKIERRCSGKDDDTCEVIGGWEKVRKLSPGEEYTITLNPEDPAYVELSSQYIIECTEDGATGTCDFSAILADDTNYEQFRVGDGAVLNRLNVSVNTTSIPTGAKITNATVCILAYRDSILGDDPGDSCGIYAGENATGTPTYTVAVSKTQATCTSWTTTVGDPNAVCGEITSWLNSKPDPVASARKLIIVFEGTEEKDNNVDLWIDYIYANITYTTPPQYSNAGSNTTTPNVNEPVLHYVYWQDDEELSGYIFSSNYSGSWQNDSFVPMTGSANWSNVTKNAPGSSGTFGWRIYANDSENAWNATPVQLIQVQNSPPDVQLNLPANNTQFNNTQDINFNFTVTDEKSSVLNCSIWLDGGLNQTNSSTLNNTLTNFLISGIPYGSHSWYVNCSDGEKYNWSETRYFIIADTVPPSVSIQSPQNITYNTTTLTLNYTVSDENIQSCWYSLNGQNTTLPGCQNTTIQVQGGINNLVVYVNDSYGNLGSDEVVFTAYFNTSLTIGRVPPDPVEIDASFWIWANYTYTNGTPILNATCNLYGQFGITMLYYHIGGADDPNDAIYNHTYRRQDFLNIPQNKTQYLYAVKVKKVNSPEDNLYVYMRCDGNYTPDPDYLIGNLSPADAATTWQWFEISINGSRFPNGANNCSFILTSPGSSTGKWSIYQSDLTSGHTFISTDAGQSWSETGNEDYAELRYFPEANHTYLDWSETDQRYEKYMYRKSPGVYGYSINCTKDWHVPREDSDMVNVTDTVAPYVEITKIEPNPAELLHDNITIEWMAFDRDLDVKYANVTYPNGTLLVQSVESPINLSASQISVEGNYTLTVFANDTSGNFSITNSTLIVIDLPPATITGLSATLKGSGWIYWEWNNPTDPDFNHSEIWIDGQWQLNTSNTSYNATGFFPNTAHTISIRTIDKAGNVNTTFVNNTATTLCLLNGTVTDALGSVVPSTINVSNATFSASGSENYSFDLVCGEYNISIKPNNRSIREILIYNYNISGLVENIVKIDDPDEDITTPDIIENWIEISAWQVNEANNYTGVNVTIAYGEGTNLQLWKCANWNFTNRSCQTWQYMQDVPDGRTTVTRYFERGDPGVGIGKKDTTPPTYSNDQDDSGGMTVENMTVNVSVYWQDNKKLNTAIFRTNQSGSWQNVSYCLIQQQGGWCNKTINTTGEAGKMICWNEWANDTAGNWNSTMPMHCFKVVLPNYPPYWSDNQSSTPVVYSQVQSQFNITWKDSSGVAQALIEGNWSGQPENYTMSLVSGNQTDGVWSYTAILPAGTFYWKSYANDTEDQWNSTPTWVFAISKAETLLNLTASPDWNVTYGTQTNVSCKANNQEVQLNLYRNGTQVTIPDVQTLAAGVYNYTCKTDGSQNYTANQTWNLLRVEKAETQVNLTLNGQEANISLTYPESLTAVFWTNTGTATLYRNGTNVSSENGSTVVLPAGYWNYTVINPGNQNYTSSSKTLFARVNRAQSSCSLNFSPSSPQTYPVQVNVSCSCTNPEAQARLYRNGTDVTAENNQYVQLPAGTWLYVCNVTETQNYTGAEVSSSYIINKAPSNLTLLLNGSEKNLTILTNTTANLTAILLEPSSGYLELYENGIMLDNGSSPLIVIKHYADPGLYNITAVYPETQNYSSSLQTLWLRVVNDTEPPTISLHASSQSLQAGERLSASCSATDDQAVLELNLTIDGEKLCTGNPCSAEWTAKAGEWTLRCTAADLAGNLAEKSLKITVSTPSRPSRPGIPAPAKPPVELVHLEPNKPEEIQVNVGPVRSLSLMAGKTVSGTINLSQKECPPINTTRPVYACFEIQHNLTDIKQANISFCVNRSWISAYNLSSAILMRLNRSWDSLLTHELEDNDQEICYLSESPGLSLFAILGLNIPRVCEPLERQCIGDVLQECNIEGTGWVQIEECLWGCEEGRCKESPECKEGSRICAENKLLVCQNNSWILAEECVYCISGICLKPDRTWFWYLLGIIILAVIVFFGFRKRKRIEFEIVERKGKKD